MLMRQGKTNRDATPATPQHVLKHSLTLPRKSDLPKKRRRPISIEKQRKCSEGRSLDRLPESVSFSCEKQQREGVREGAQHSHKQVVTNQCSSLFRRFLVRLAILGLCGCAVYATSILSIEPADQVWGRREGKLINSPAVFRPCTHWAVRDGQFSCVQSATPMPSTYPLRSIYGSNSVVHIAAMGWWGLHDKFNSSVAKSIVQHGGM